jgi:hypothetical protein
VDELTTRQGIFSHKILHFGFHCIRDSARAGAEGLRGEIIPQQGVYR